MGSETSLPNADLVPSAEFHQELADRLWGAERGGAPIPPLSEEFPLLTVDDAYAIQTINVEKKLAEGRLLRGRKVGLTAKAMQQLVGVNEPDFGILLDDMFVEDGEEIPTDSLLQPRVEAEIAFLLGEDLAGPGVTTSNVLAAVKGVLPAIEIVDSRIADWKVALVDTVADNASSGRLVVGGCIKPVDFLDLRLMGIVLSRNGQVVETGAGAAALGNPARCVAWLANKLAKFDTKLRSGDIVLPGALHRMVVAQPGDTFRAEFEHLGAVTVRFSDESDRS